MVERTSLSLLSVTEQVAASVALLLDRTDGVFLAARLMAGALCKRDARDGSVRLTLADLEALFTAKGDRLVDDEYSSTLQRVDARLHALAAGDKGIEAALQAAQRRTLTWVSVLLAAVVPPR